MEQLEKGLAASGVLPKVTEIVSGGARGVDTLAEQYAEAHNIPFTLFPADWETHGKKSGFLRNAEMAHYADYGVAIWDGESRGTKHMISLMRNRVYVRKNIKQGLGQPEAIVTELAAVASLKRIYESIVPGQLEWNFLTPGRVIATDGSLTAQNGTLIGLSLRGHEISDLSPLADLTNLTTLNLEGNEISDLSPLTGMTKLTELWLWNNKIHDLSPLAGMTKLTCLDLWNNEINDLSPLAGLTNLTRLNLTTLAATNHINDLSPLAGLTKLTALYLEGNEINDLSSLAGLTKLTVLCLGSNKINDLSPLAGLTKLKTLFLGNNEMSDLSPLAGLVHLKSIDLGNCPVTDLSPLSRLPKLKLLNGKEYRRPISKL